MESHLAGARTKSGFRPIMLLIRRLLVLLALVALAFAAPPKTPASHPPSANIFLITLDTTRADRMGFLGSKLNLTPNLDALAQQSAVFSRAYSQVPLTPPSHASILTGTYPQFHGVLVFDTELRKDVPYAPEILHAHGYHTAAFVGSIVLDPHHASGAGFDRGFDHYDASFRDIRPGESRYATIQRRGTEVVAHALAWLSKHPKGPFFIWVHLYDAHDPYDPPEPFKTRYASEPYDGAIAYEDYAVGKLLAGLKARGLYDNSAIAIAADHGEGLGAHGEETHGIFLYDETIHVPLLIKLPHERTGARIDDPVELIDLLPTSLQAVKIESPAEIQGQSLLGLIQEDAAGADSNAAAPLRFNRPAYSQTHYPRTYGWSPLESLRTNKYLYIQAPRRELYDQNVDPEDEHNLAPASPATADTLASQLQSLREKTTNHADAPVPAARDPRATEQLSALGYMAGQNITAKSDPGTNLPDPKDTIEVANMIQRADTLHNQQHNDEAVALFQKAIDKNPNPPVSSYIQLGQWLVSEKKYREAIPALRKAVEMDRKDPMNHLRLGEAYLRLNDNDNAIPELEIAEAKHPESTQIHFLLQRAYTQANRTQDVLRECNIILQFAPDHYPTYLIMGRFLELSGDKEGAVASLKKASALEPKAPDPHIILAVVYDHMGKKSDAVRERATAKRLGATAEQLKFDGKAQPPS
jgi:arylsulfatase A-like enzyme/Flp pilus assembly protein TadD